MNSLNPMMLWTEIGWNQPSGKSSQTVRKMDRRTNDGWHAGGQKSSLSARVSQKKPRILWKFWYTVRPLTVKRIKRSCLRLGFQAAKGVGTRAVVCHLWRITKLHEFLVRSFVEHLVKANHQYIREGKQLAAIYQFKISHGTFYKR